MKDEELRSALQRLANVFRHGRAEEDLAREVAAHLAVLEDEYRRQGMPTDEARYAARRAMGGVEQAKEHHRDARAFRWLDDLRRDTRRAVRVLVKNPGFSAVAVITLALGIGANTAVYSAIDAVFFRSLPFSDPERLVDVRGFPVPIRELDTSGHGLSFTDLSALRDVFSHSAAYATGAWNLGSGVEPRRVAVTFASAEFFATLGRAPFLGRTFAPEEASAGGPNVTVVSHALWRSQFDSDPAIVGRTITLNEELYEVVGVMPEDFRFPAEAQLWVPLPVPYPRALFTAFRNYFPGRIVARLAVGVTPERATERVLALPRPSDPARNPSVTPFRRSLAGDRRVGLTLLMASAALVLLIACANVANLLLSRAAVRRHEMAMCGILGATRSRLFRQLLVESLLLALLGATTGVALAYVARSGLTALMPPELAGLAPAQIDLRVLGFTLALAMLTAIAFGLWPAAGASRADVNDALKGMGDRPGRVSGLLKHGLVVTEVALACMLAVGAGLMLASLRALVSIDVGMRVDAVASARLNFPDGTYADEAVRTGFIRSVLARLERAPGVEEAAAINTLPFAQEGGIRVLVFAEGREPDDAEHGPFAPYLVVSPRYFQTMGIPLLSGRSLTWADDKTDPVAVINRTLARTLWPDEDPLGQQFVFGAGPGMTVVGVVDDARTDRLDSEILPQVYMPLRERSESYVSIVARGTDDGDVGALLGHIRTAVRATDPSLPIYAALPMRAVIGETVAPQRANTLVISVFGALALCLAGIGIYGVLAYAVAQRTREIGVRMALGAGRTEMLAMVLGRGMALSAIGIGLGVAGAIATTRYLTSLLFGVAPLDPTTFVAVVAMFTIAALFASYLPARRATKVDPLVALRYE